MSYLNNMVKVFSGFDEKFANKPILISVRRGLTYMIPVLLVGSMALVFISLPIRAYQEMMEYVFGSQWKCFFLYVRDGTFSILSLIMVICISYSYYIETGQRTDYNVSPVIAVSVSLCSFIAISGISNEGFILANFGVIGVFAAMVVAVTSSMLFLKLCLIEALRIKAFTDGANSIFNYALTSIYPAAITIAIFAAFHQLLTKFFGISDFQNFISDLLCTLFTRIESPFWSGIIFIVLIHIFWFFGMHGSNILEPVAQTIFVPALTNNQILLEGGKAPTEIFTKTFFDTFVLMGGCGTTLCLIIAIIIEGRYKNQLRLAKLSFIPVLFNINELIVFGIPIVLNPVYIIPFLCIPIILTVNSFFAMYYGLVPYTCNLVEWTTPIILSGFTSTNSIKGSILQLFNLGLGILCYLPFVRLAQGVCDFQGRNNLQRVYKMYKIGEERGMASTLLSRYDEIGNISRFLAVDLENDLVNNKVTLFYQPQVDFDGNIFGVEALLRWKHDSYGYIYPPLTIALAEESGLINRLGYWVFDTACNELKKFYNAGLDTITVSVNVSAIQLEDVSFINNLEKIIKRHKIKPQTLKIEITEQLALASNTKIINQIKAIKKLGIKLAIDDFGMGHSSLMYLKEYDFDTIKLDGSLVREILTNSNCRNIISSLVFLSKSLNCSVIAEYVETEEQRNALHEIGCNLYQGYLYSKAIRSEEVIKYISNRTCLASKISCK